MKRLPLICLNRLISAVRLTAGALLLTPLLALVVYVNYSIDCQGYFLGDVDLRGIVDLILDGKDIIGFDRILSRQREVLTMLAKGRNAEYITEKLVISSHTAKPMPEPRALEEPL